MKLLKCTSKFVSKTKKFCCEDINKRVRGGNNVSSGVIFTDDINTFHFGIGGNNITVVSIVNDHNRDTWSLSSNVDKKLVTITANNRLKMFPSSMVFESMIDIGVGCVELLHWKIVSNRRSDISFVGYDPELNDALIVQFSQVNCINVCVHIFPGGYSRFMCSPDSNFKNFGNCIEVMTSEACGVLDIIKDLV